MRDKNIMTPEQFVFWLRGYLDNETRSCQKTGRVPFINHNDFCEIMSLLSDVTIKRIG